LGLGATASEATIAGALVSAQVAGSASLMQDAFAGDQPDTREAVERELGALVGNGIAGIVLGPIMTVTDLVISTIISETIEDVIDLGTGFLNPSGWDWSREPDYPNADPPEISLPIE